MSHESHLSRPAERTAVSLWRSLVGPEQIKRVLRELADFRMIKPQHARATFESSIADYSLNLLRRQEQGMVNEDVISIYTYEINVWRREQLLVVSGRDVLADGIYGHLGACYRSMFEAEFPVTRVQLDIRKLVDDHPGRVTRMHVALNNTSGLSSLTLYGDDVDESELFRRQLATATITSARLRDPFWLQGAAVEFSAHGTLQCDRVLAEDIVIRLAVELAKNYQPVPV